MSASLNASFVVGLSVMLGACSAGAPRDGAAAGPPPATVEPGAGDASYDWHVLMPAPFGTLLKKMPEALHEVLVFHDQSSGSAEPDLKDCYTRDGTPPRFLDRQPEGYLLCFDHDRMKRIEATVRVDALEAAQVLARACALWRKNAASAADEGVACEGREDGVAFEARLAPPSDEAAGSAEAARLGKSPMALSVTLTAAMDDSEPSP